MKHFIKYAIYFSLFVLVFNLQEPDDPCTNFANPKNLSDCTYIKTIYPNSLCCFLTSTKNGQTLNACFPSSDGVSKSYNANGIAAKFICSGFLQKISYLIILAFLANILI